MESALFWAVTVRTVGIIVGFVTLEKMGLIGCTDTTLKLLPICAA